MCSSLYPPEAILFFFVGKIDGNLEKILYFYKPGAHVRTLLDGAPESFSIYTCGPRNDVSRFNIIQISLGMKEDDSFGRLKRVREVISI